MSYNSTTKHITAPVSIKDLQQCFGLSDTDLGTLISKANINIWAKYKPVRLNSIDTVTNQWDATNNTWKNTATWWKGSTVTAIGGIVPKQVLGLDNLAAQYDGNLNGWIYNKPSGGSLQPYRLQDFAGYNHNAIKAIDSFYINNSIVQNGSFTASAIKASPSIQTDNLTLSDFSSQAFDTLYWGIVFTQNGQAKAAVTSQTAGDASVSATFEGSGNSLPLGTYKVYPFFTDTQILISQTVMPSQQYFFTCPNLVPIDVQIISSSADVTVSALYMSSAKTSIQFVIQGDPNRVLTNNSWYVLPTSYYYNPSAGVSAQAYVASGSITQISMGETYRGTARLTTAGDYFMYFLFNRGVYDAKTMIMEPLH